MRPLARTLPIAIVLVAATSAGPVPPAVAATIDVSMTSSSTFSPGTVTVAQGDTVRWTNNDNVSHTSKSKQDFWNGPSISTGQTYEADFLNAGSFGYFCEIHGSGMSGTIKVRMKKNGSPSTGWTIRWSSLASPPENRTFDVQIKRPGSSSFTGWKTNVSARSASFNPSQNGTYAFRARTDNTTNDKSSGFSPVMSVSIS